MKKVIKRTIPAILTICVLLAFAIMAMSSSSESTTEEQEAGETENTVNTDNETLGDYTVTIDSCRLAEDWDGNPIAIVKYTFTNNSDEASSFNVAFTDSAYQDGVEMEHCYFADESANYSDDNQSKKIKSDTSIEVEVAYTLNDTTTDIQVELEEFISFNDKIITKTFKIAQ